MKKWIMDAGEVVFLKLLVTSTAEFRGSYRFGQIEWACKIVRT